MSRSKQLAKQIDATERLSVYERTGWG